LPPSQRISKFDRILDKAPAMFSAAQLRVFLRVLVNIDPYTFDDVAEQLAANDENNQQTSEEILLSTIDGLPDDKLTGFALRLVITAHIPIPREGELDYLAEAEIAFAPPQPKKTASKKTTTTPTSIKAAKKSAAKKTTAKKEVAERQGRLRESHRMASRLCLEESLEVRQDPAERAAHHPGRHSAVSRGRG
jgi:ParB family chromosome partitioning protein